MHDYIPGMVQKIAFDQINNEKVAMVYRILKNDGYIYRVRIYNLRNCSSEIQNVDDIEAQLDEVVDNEKKYTDE